MPKHSPEQLTSEDFEKIRKISKLRRAVGYHSHRLFFHIYFPLHVTYEIAPFQIELFHLSEDSSIKLLGIMAFRNSGKSTILNMSYAIWSVLGQPQRKHIVIVSRTKAQAVLHYKNIKRELESNSILRRDLGPFREQEDEWNVGSLFIPKYNARITAVSMEQSVRGMRSGAYRPDLIICDDVEDIESVRTQESRDKTWQWLTGELMQAGTPETQVVILGNMLHEDSVLIRFQKRINEKQMDGVIKRYPLLDINGSVLWPGMFSTKEKLDAFKRKVPDERTWQREYMLTIVPEDDQVVLSEWIKYYDELPRRPEWEETMILTGVDLAVGQKNTSDYTAMVTARIFTNRQGKLHIYVLPNPVNRRLTFEEIIANARDVADRVGWQRHTFVVEVVSSQAYVAQILEKEGLRIKPFHPHDDKRERLTVAASPLQRGEVFFPRTGAELLVKQLLSFGQEKHDDLVDALVMIILEAMEKRRNVFLPGRLNFPFMGGSSIAGNLMKQKF